jgi:hypothetical protein
MTRIVKNLPDCQNDTGSVGMTADDVGGWDGDRGLCVCV